MIWRGNGQVYVLDSVKHAPERLYILAKSHGQDPMQWTTMDIHEAEYRFQKGVHLILCWIKTATRVIRMCPSPHFLKSNKGQIHLQEAYLFDSMKSLASTLVVDGGG